MVFSPRNLDDCNRRTEPCALREESQRARGGDLANLAVLGVLMSEFVLSVATARTARRPATRWPAAMLRQDLRAVGSLAIASDLQDVAFAGDHFVQHRIDEKWR